jgi:hypothetical protein
LFKALDYDDLPRNEDAFATAYLSKLKLYLSLIVGYADYGRKLVNLLSSDPYSKERKKERKLYQHIHTSRATPSSCIFKL